MGAASTIASVVIAAIAALAAAPSPSRAADAADAADDQGFAAGMFGGPVTPEKAEACFVRRYDTKHLARHKRQQVTSMRLLVTAEKAPDYEGLVYHYRAAIKLRNRAGDFDADGFCGGARISEEPGERPTLSCETSCEGGGMTIALSDDNKSTILALSSIFITPHGKDESKSRPLKGGADDRKFRLDRAPLADCPTPPTDHVAAQ
jgi:hypothetical protein